MSESFPIKDVPGELLLEIILKLQPKEILRLCRVSQYFNETICKTNLGHIWDELYRRDIDIRGPLPPEGGQTAFPNDPRREYVRIMTEITKIEKIPNKDQRIRSLLDFAVRNNYHSMIENILKDDFEYFDYVAIIAALFNRRDILEDMLKRNPENFDEIIANAVYGGHLDLVHKLIAKRRRDGLRFDDSWALAAAAEGGHLDIINDLIDHYGARDFIRAINSAAYSGHIEIMRQMIQRSLDAGLVPNFNVALGAAAAGGHLDVVDELIDVYGANLFNQVLWRAARAGRLEIFRRLLSRAAENNQEIEFVDLLDNAIAGGHLNIVQEILSHTNLDSSVISDAIARAIQSGHPEIADYLRNYLV